MLFFRRSSRPAYPITGHPSSPTYPPPIPAAAPFLRDRKITFRIREEERATSRPNAFRANGIVAERFRGLSHWRANKTRNVYVSVRRTEDISLYPYTHSRIYVYGGALHSVPNGKILYDYYFPE
ncbi:hypothetical protein Trydic_g20480 [Trypoxylus dichotomus]